MVKYIPSWEINTRKFSKVTGFNELIGKRVDPQGIMQGKNYRMGKII